MAYGKLNGHMTLKGQGHDPSTLKAQYFVNSWNAI